MLATERDFYETARAFLDRCRDENVIHVEISFDPQPHIARGIPIEAVMGGILAARREARVSTRLIMCANRDRSLDDAMPLFDLVRPWREHIAGVGLDSAERGNPPVKFAAFYDQAAIRRLPASPRIATSIRTTRSSTSGSASTC